MAVLSTKKKKVNHKTNQTEKKLDSLIDSVSSLADTVGELSETVSTLTEDVSHLKDAKNNPVIIPKTFEPLEHQIGQDHVVTGAENDSAIIRPKADIDPDSPAFKEKAANEAFMQDELEVYFQTDSNKNAQRVFTVMVNGEEKILERGKSFKLKRYFVETLARAKLTGYGNEEYTRDDGVTDFRWPSQTGLRYPFSVTKDPHPRGNEWLESVLAQP